MELRFSFGFEKFIFTFFVWTIISCSNKEEIKTPAIGEVSINANLSLSEPLENYVAEYQLINSLGSSAAQTAAPWSSLNPTGAIYDFAVVSNPYFGLAKLTSLGFSSILLNVLIVDIGERKMPADIATLPFNDVLVKNRFRQLIDQLSPLLTNVSYLALGNEVDSYFATHQAEWLPYIELVNDAKAYIASKKANIKIGVTTTFDGFSDGQKDFVKMLNAQMDVVFLTYYPISPNFIVRETNVVLSDFDLMIQLAGDKQLVFQEAGYPSSPVLGSSEQSQADFVTQVFAAWRKYGPEKIPIISFFKYRDWNPMHVKQVTGQDKGQSFYEFLSTLGLLKNDRSPKKAYEILQTELLK